MTANDGFQGGWYHIEMVTRIGHGPGKRRRTLIKEWREYRDLTQQQLADRIGTTKATISRIETGQRDWTGSFLSAVADALGCEPQDLLVRNPLLDREDPVSEFRSLPPDAQGEVLDFVRFLKQRRDA